jgi:uncharacterized protein
MSAPLPQSLDPWRAALTGAAFVGSVTLAELPRLAGAVIGVEGPACFDLRFEQDAEGRAVVLGRVTLMARLICQRCLGDSSYPLDVPIAWVLVKSDVDSDDLGLAEVPGIPDHLEPLPVVGDAPIHPLALIEDELLLAIPLVPMHRAGECQAEMPVNLAGAEIGEADTRQHPFAVLATLKSGG